MERSVMFACIFTPATPDGLSLSEFAYSFSPLLEETSADTVVIDVDGCELLFGSAYELANEIARRAIQPPSTGGLGCKVNVALAANPDTAIHAAKFLKGISFICPGEEITGLGDLAIDSICFELVGLEEKSFQDILETLKLWGIHTFKDFAALPLAGVSQRLGQAGVSLQLLASGKTERHLKLKQTPPVFTNSIEFDYPISELEPLSFILSRLLNQLCARLNAYALATNQLQVQMKLENGSSHDRTLNLPYAMRDHKVFLKLLLLDTEMHPPPTAIIALKLYCEPVKPRVTQNGLFIPLAPEPEKLELTLARLAKLLGEGNIGSPELLDTHRPDAFRIKRFTLRQLNKRVFRKSQPRVSASPLPPFSVLAFRMFRPPLRALVEAAKGYPTQVSAWSADRSVHGKIVQLAGPWRTTGDWWRADSWARDEWDIAVESRTEKRGTSYQPLQVLYRIYRELRSGTWFVEGVYD
jgi:protein ImuB